MNKIFLLAGLFLLIFTGSSWADGVVFDGNTISELIRCHEGRLKSGNSKLQVMDSERPIDLSLDDIPSSTTYKLGLDYEGSSKNGFIAHAALLNTRRVTLCVTYSHPDSFEGGTVNQITDLSLRAN